MTSQELTRKLKAMYESGLHSRDGSNMVRLFGIIYADDLAHYDTATLDQIADHATGKNTYIHEVRKGMKLAEYVELKAQHRDRF